MKKLIIRNKIGIDLDVKPETVTEENLAPVTPEPNTKKEEATKAETVIVEEIKKEEAPKAETNTEKKLKNIPEKK